MPESILPMLTTVGTSLLSSLGGNLVSKLFNSGGGSQNIQKEISAKPKALFNPQQIRQATDKYSTEGTAKWNQILANMGAGGGTGGPDVSTQIGTQAGALSKALGGLNTDSGYGENGMNQIGDIMKALEGGISPKYSVYS